MQVFPLHSSVLPEAFPIKASDYTDVWALLFIERVGNVSPVDTKNIFALAG